MGNKLKTIRTYEFGFGKVSSFIRFESHSHCVDSMLADKLHALLENDFASLILDLNAAS